MLNARPPRDQLGAVLRGLGAAVPSHRATKEDTERFLVRAAGAQEGCTPRLLRTISSMAETCGVAARHSVLPDYTATSPEDFAFFPDNWRLEPFPSTAKRMAIYRDEAAPLAVRAAAEALADADIAPASVTHLVLSTCTGFFAPGPELLLASALGLSPNVQRTIVGFMGCYAGINALRVADQIVRSDPSAVVLQVAVELCTLHYQRDPKLSTAIANLLFGDGAAAAVYTGSGRGYGRVAATRSAIAAGTADQMRWDIGDHGFVMHLGSKVPRSIRAHAAPFIRDLADAGPPREGRIGWAVHPGGRRIVEAVAESMDLAQSDVASSFDVLRDYGNLSSATVFFVLKRELARRRPGDRILMLGFGPGLTMEGASIDVLG